jgi:putative transposase
MTFIRAKEIPPRSGNWYDYEVMTVHEGGRVRQKVIRYIGRSGSHPIPSGHSTLESGISPKPLIISIPDDTRIYKMKTPAKQIASALGMYYGGMSLDAVQQQFKQDYDLDMSESNFWNWVKRFTKEAIKQAKKFQPNVGDHWVADETYMKLGKRNVYFWDIIDADTRFLLATHVSFTRTSKDAQSLMELAKQRAGKSPKVVVTDKLASYIAGIEEAYGGDSRHLRGGPFSLEHSTSLIERFHRTLEQRTKVFQKFKDIEDIRLLTGGWLVNYNFFKQNEGCGNIPPAQAMSKVVPFKDWNDIVKPESIPETEYRVSLRRRESVKKGYPVFDARLIPFTEQDK